MAGHINYIAQSDVFFSCTEKEYFASEHCIPEHGLAHLYSGSIVVAEAGGTTVFNAGDTILFRRNQLAKITKRPAADGPCKSVTITFRQPFLQQYYAKHAVDKNTLEPVTAIHFEQNPLLDSLFNSILPYYNLQNELPAELVDMKVMEAITILRSIDKNADCILAEFAEPGKIDLVDFMEKNYSYNISIRQFAHLTGRSLATFKRDFQKSFHAPPQRWLLQKRLEQAHFLIAERKQKPSDTYLEVGFENLSHFSTAFKEMFGYNPSSVS